MRFSAARWLQIATAAGLLLAVAGVMASLAAGQLAAVPAVAVGLLATSAALTVLGLRQLRNRVALTEQRLRVHGAAAASASGSHAASGDPGSTVQEELMLLRSRLDVSEAMLAVAQPSRRAEVPTSSAVSALRRLLALERVLDADQVALRFDLTDDLPLGVVRALGRGLRARGYLARAQVYFERAAAIGDARDTRMLDLRAAEVAMMSGAFRPSVPTIEIDSRRSDRVLHVVGRAIPTTQTGYTLRTHGTAKAQASRGLETHVFVQSGVVKGERPSSDLVEGVRYHRHLGGSVFDLGHRRWLQENAEALHRLVVELRPAVLHAHSDFINGLLATAVGRATGTPVVYESRGFWEETWLSRTCTTHGWADGQDVFARYGVPESYRWRRQREADVRAAADSVVTLGRAMRDRIVAEGLSDDHVTIVPNAVDADEFSRPARADLLAHALGITPGAVVVGCVTSVVEYEGLSTLVDAFAEVSRVTDAPTWLLIVGDGPVLADLRALVTARGLRCVSTPGRVPHDQVPDFLSLIDIFVVPRTDVDVCRLVTPLKPFEALSAGCALVMSDVPALREIAEDSGAVELVTPDSSHALAATLISLAERPTLRRQMAERGARWVRESRSWHRNVDRYADVYRSVSLDLDVIASGGAP